MANFVYNLAAKEIADGTLNLETDTIKVMLVDNSYTADKDDDVVDAGGANDPVDAEISVTGYTGGWGGSGRHAITGTPDWTEDDTNDRAVYDGGDPATWTSLGTGATIQAAILIKEGVTDDTGSRLIAYIDTSTGTPSLPFTTTGGDFTINFNTDGIILLNT